jgi:two-component system sensor histidine kinase VicK
LSRAHPPQCNCRQYDAIISKNLNGVIQSANPAAERVFGYTAPELIRRELRILIPLERQFEEDDILSRLRRGERVEHFEGRRGPWASRSGR